MLFNVFQKFYTTYPANVFTRFVPNKFLNLKIGCDAYITYTLAGSCWMEVIVTPSVLRPKQIIKPCREHHVYMIMHVMEYVDNIFVTSDDQ